MTFTLLQKDNDKEVNHSATTAKQWVEENEPR